jgi:hypothetical protein
VKARTFLHEFRGPGPQVIKVLAQSDAVTVPRLPRNSRCTRRRLAYKFPFPAGYLVDTATRSVGYDLHVVCQRAGCGVWRTGVPSGAVLYCDSESITRLRTPMQAAAASWFALRYRRLRHSASLERLGSIGGEIAIRSGMRSLEAREKHHRQPKYSHSLTQSRNEWRH